MNLVAYDRKKLDVRSYVYGKNMELIEEFRDSDLDCVKVEGWTHKNAGICAGALNDSIKRCKAFTIRAISRNGEVYLIKK